MITAIVHIRVKSALIPETAEALATVKGVCDVYSVTGDWDLILVVKVPEHEDLARVISDEISKSEGVLETRTQIAFKTYSGTELQAAFDLGLG